MGLRLLGQVAEVLGVAPPDVFELAGSGQPLGRELVDRLQHPEPHLALTELFLADQALVQQ